MYKKIKVTMALLIVLAMPITVDKINAATINGTPENIVFVQGISDFFAKLFHRTPAIKDLPTVGADTTNPYVKNTATGCGTDGKCNNGSGVIDFKNVYGIVVSKDMIGQNDGGNGIGDGQTPDNYAGAGDTVQVVIQATNTGTTTTDIVIKEPALDSNFSYNETDAVLDGDGNTVGTIGDLYDPTKGITFKDVPGRDVVEIHFNVKIINTKLSLDDKSENVVEVCQKVDPSTVTTAAIHAHGDNIPDGKYNSADSTVCANGADDLWINDKNDPITPTPDVSGLIVGKTVDDENTTGIDGVAEAGETLNYTITVVNTGDKEKTFQVQDKLDASDSKIDANVIFQDTDSLTISQGATGKTVKDLKNGFELTLPAGETSVIKFNGVVKSPIDNYSLVDGKDIANTVYVNDIDDATIKEEATTTISANLLGDLTIDKVADKTTEIGTDPLGYTITITNDGQKEITNKMLIDVLPPSSAISKDPEQVLTITPATANVTPASGTATLGDLISGDMTIDSIKPGETISIRYTIAINPLDPTDTSTTYTNIAQVCDPSGTPCINDSEIVTPGTTEPIKDFGIQKEVTDTDGDGLQAPGENLNYTISLTNNSDENAIIKVQDALADQAFDLSLSTTNPLIIDSNGQFVKADGTVDSSSKTVQDIIDGTSVQILPNQTAKLTFTVATKKDIIYDTALDDPATVKNTITATDKDGASNDTVAEITTVGNSDMSIEKTVTDTDGNDQADANEDLNYVITLMNKGNQNTTVKVLDYLPLVNLDYPTSIMDQILTIESSLSTPPITNPAIGTAKLSDLSGSGVTINDVKPGEKITIKFKLHTQDPLKNVGENINNIATISYKNTSGDEIVASDDALIGTEGSVEPDPDFSVSKSVSDATGDGGNGSNLAEPSDYAPTGDGSLTFRIIISNNPSDSSITAKEQTYTIKESDLYSSDSQYALDKNLDFKALSGDVELETPATGVAFVGSHTIADLTGVDNDANSFISDAELSSAPGLKVKIPANQAAVLKYSVPVKTIADWELTDTIANKITATDADGNSNDAFTNIDTVGTEGLTIDKSDVKVIDSDGTEYDSTTASMPYINLTNGSVGDKISYKIHLVNTGTLAFKGPEGTAVAPNLGPLTLTDIPNYSFFFNGDTATMLPNMTITEYVGEDDTTAQDTTGPNMTTVVSSEELSFGYVYPNDLEAGHSLDVTFTWDLSAGLEDILDDEEMVSNSAQICYDSKGLSSEKTVGNRCLSSGATTPVDKDGTEPDATKVDDGGFFISKELAGKPANEAALPGETLTWKINIINNDSDAEKVIHLTDELFDTNEDFEAALLNNISIVDAAGTPVKVDNGSGMQIYDESTAPIKVQKLLPLDTDTWKHADAKTRWSGVAASDRGGIDITIPANHEISVSFDVNTKGTPGLKMRIRNFFDIKRFYS